jgi:hypothetical protein
MTIAWHRTEPRDVRPFFETVKAENALADTGIRLFANDDTFFDPSFDLDEIDFQKLEPVVYITMVDPTLWMPDGLSANDLELVLIARHSFLKRSEVVSRHSLAGIIPSEIPIESDMLERLGGGRNLQITLALCLAIDREPVPGTPFVPGHWLARKAFLLRSRTMPALFDLQTRTDEAWKAAGFPAKTFFAVDYAGGIAGEMEDGSSVATVYVHIDAHNKMINSPIGDALQPMLAAEIILTIMLISFADWKDLELIDPASPLATLAKQLGDGTPLGLDDMKKLGHDSAKLRALLQDRLSVVRAI